MFQATDAGAPTGLRHASYALGTGLVTTAAVGATIGIVAALTLTIVLHRFWLPDYLQIPVTIMLVLAAFVVAELLRAQAGLVSATVMGIGMANQRRVDIRRIVEFKESLTVLFVSCLFIVLSARVSARSLTALGWRGFVFVIALLVVVRPLCVWLSNIGSTLNWREKVFLAWFAPRGIVAASVASIFAIQMGSGGETIASATLLVVFVSVAVYGLTAGPLARHLKLAVARAEGVLIAGANPLARAIAKALQDANFTILLVDSRYSGIREAHAAGLPAVYGDILSDHTLDRIDLSALGRFLALTSNDDVNTLASTILRAIFGREHVYQMARSLRKEPVKSSEVPHLGGRTLFGSEFLYERLDEGLQRGAVIKTTPLTAEFGLEQFADHYGVAACPLFVVDGGHLSVVTLDAPCRAIAGQSIISLVFTALQIPSDANRDDRGVVLPEPVD